MEDARQIPPFGLRMPEALKERIKDIAAENRRSMNSEIVVILESVVGRIAETEKGTAVVSAS
jgi:hypothetical protein